MAKKTQKGKKTRLPVPRAISRMYPEVKYVEDADKYVTVNVSKRDCEGAKELDPTNCAMARAVRKEFHADGAVIGTSTSYVIRGNKAIRFETPDSVRREIVSFDRHHDFEPGEYYLRPKSKSAKLGKETRTSADKKASRKRSDERRRHDSAIPILHKATARVRQLPHGQDYE